MEPGKIDSMNLNIPPYEFFEKHSSFPFIAGIFYMFDWGDTSSGWLGPYESGIICEAIHTWTEKGSYEIKVKAKDINGLVSDWSDPLEVSMPKSKSYSNNMLQLFFERLFELLAC